MHVYGILAVCIEIFRKNNKKSLTVVASGKEACGGWEVVACSLFYSFGLTEFFTIIT